MDPKNLSVGDKVRVRTVSGAIQDRIVVGHTDEGDPLLASMDHYEQARKESKEPEGIGWPAEFILEPTPA